VGVAEDQGHPLYLFNIRYIFLSEEKQMKVYSFSTTIPLDANGNPSGIHKPTMEDVLVTSALLSHFFGSRFSIIGSVVKRAWLNRSDYVLEDTINFDPLSSRPTLIDFVARQQCPAYFEDLPNITTLNGTGIFSGKEYSFRFLRDCNAPVLLL
jgi:hypothetical protein